ncbi:hypothetical protein GA0074692_2732 [Micromonospora pallida]|uniref:Uncharacterized protein n=1 Tax=Micromonospora pallida TaxID=145854 RepID=A0A1C6SIU3_9ACTN|nr:hypothetical protein [Micromonospora pallida]SCL29474.1 hypothetical protein GA0074692_2732 [Micromonospora pallida]
MLERLGLLSQVRLTWCKQKDWRIEVGLANVRVPDVQALCEVCQAAPELTDLLVDLAPAHVWRLVAVTATGPFLLPKSVKGLFWPLRWWWRRRRMHHARHARPDEGFLTLAPKRTVAPERRPGREAIGGRRRTRRVNRRVDCLLSQW